MKRGVEAKQWYVPGAISRDLRKSYKNKPFASLDLRFSEEEEESLREQSGNVVMWCISSSFFSSFFITWTLIV